MKPHLDSLFARFPQLLDGVATILDDGAADDQKIKESITEAHDVELLTPINPRARKPIVDDLPRGIDHITNIGTPVCREGFPFDFVCCRHDTEHFVFRAPRAESDEYVCKGCKSASKCYRGAEGGRQITIPFSRLPWIDPDFPQPSKRFHKVISKRTAIERIHKLMKFDYGEERLYKRGNISFQARLDKTLLAMHIVLGEM